MAFYAIKTRSSKSRKIDIFLKGLTHGLNPKMAIFQTFYLSNIDQENVFYDILKRKNAFLDYKNKKFKKSKNSHFSKGVNPWFWSKNGHFYIFFFLGNIDQKNVFYDTLKRKDAFLGYKNKKLKKSKNWHFSKGVKLWFWSKNGHVSNFIFLNNIDQENVFYDILERKTAFLGYKNKKFKNSKNWNFSKKVNPWCWSKNGHFFYFFLGNLNQENVFYDILERKYVFLGYKNKKFKSRKIDIFVKGLTHCFGPKMAIFPTVLFFFLRSRPGKCLLR